MNSCDNIFVSMKIKIQDAIDLAMKELSDLPDSDEYISRIDRFNSIFETWLENDNTISEDSYSESGDIVSYEEHDYEDQDGMLSIMNGFMRNLGLSVDSSDASDFSEEVSVDLDSILLPEDRDAEKTTNEDNPERREDTTKDDGENKHNKKGEE